MIKKTKAYVLGIILSVVCMAGLTDTALAGTATVSWAEHPNTDGDLAGFKIYYGTSSRGSAACTTDSHGYASNVDAGNVRSKTISGLTGGQIYYFSVVAYDTSQNESCFSTEVSKSIPAVSAPAITSPTEGSALLGTSQLFEWSGDNVTNWGIDVKNSQGQTIFSHGGTGNPTQDQNTSVTVTGLPADGSDVVATLWYKTDGNWVGADYPYPTSSITYGVLDFKELFSKWLQAPAISGVLPDLNDDDIVNTRDLGIMMSNWQ